MVTVSINTPSDLATETTQATSHSHKDDMMNIIESLLYNSTPRIQKIEDDNDKNDGLFNKLFSLNMNRR